MERMERETMMKRRALAFMLALILVLPTWTGFCQNALAEKSSPRSITILLLGSDQTEGEARNASAIIIAALNLDTGVVRLASVNRDIVTKGADGGDMKLGMTMALVGPRLALETINDLFGLDITQFISVDLSGMEKIINALDGVDIDVRVSELAILMADKKTKAFQKAGLQTLSGAQALAYMKDHTGEGEDAGGSHLMKVLAACMQKGVKMGFDSLIKLVSELVAYVETNMTLMDMMEVALNVMSAGISQMETASFPSKEVLERLNHQNPMATENTEEATELKDFLYGR